MSDRSENKQIISTTGLVIRDYTDSFSRGTGVPVIGISRHRMGIDGKGITTLVAFHGCPLRCKYCLNPQCFGPAGNLPRFTPENLYAELQKDDLYFRATGGGVTFGGGEPCLQADFIVRFREICGPDWKINIETSLNVDSELVEKLAPVVDEWIVDVKTDNQMKYNEYTGGSMNRVRNNLFRLQHRYNVPAAQIVLRIPIIPGFIDAEQAEETRSRYETWGFTRFDVFTYRTKMSEETYADSGRGKAKCNILRELREEIAAQSSVVLPPHNCTHTGNCPGTCPRCESELEMLGRDRQKQVNRPIQISSKLSQRIDEFCDARKDDNEELEMQGDVMPPTELEGLVAYEPPVIYKKVFFKECAVAGVSFHLEKGDDLWFELEEGTKLALVRDRNNKHDPHAVAVALADDYDGDPDNFDFDFILGYIPRTENAELAALMDAGYADKFSAEITTLKQYGNYNDRIRLTIYLESLNPVVQRPDLLRAEWLDDDSYGKMITELKEQGFATFRWGGYPPEERNLPEAGDKIVMLHEDKENVIIHLMHVLMTDEDCLKLGIDPDELYAVDDCIHFALTNVSGPIYIDRNELTFLLSDLKNYSVQEYLSVDETVAFKQMFGITHAINNQD